ncbi:hypothetical protein HMPREF9455_03843 [Dysgonomonas gadei ATCC BAA-286]|uniref:Uncharacterized protein n=1 Tax=Dysgonomonas gadei ATCC BAA-286 TaxID=742766 RepID=F5J3C6_9BACT|nr:hypothetical protein HMPREF9455_03843 [Dysgonomonas gadei ATCC BAA-286]
MSRNSKFKNPDGIYFISFAVVNWGAGLPRDAIARQRGTCLQPDIAKGATPNRGKKRSLFFKGFHTSLLNLSFNAKLHRQILRQWRPRK